MGLLIRAGLVVLLVLAALLLIGWIALFLMLPVWYEIFSDWWE